MTIQQNYTDENYVKEVLKFRYNNATAPIPKTGVPLNNLEKDTFEKSKPETAQTKPDAVQTKPDAVQTKPAENKWLTKENIIIGTTGLALTATAATIGIIKGKGLGKTIKGLQDAVSENQRVIKGLQEAATESQAVIKGLRESADNSQKVISELREKISRLTELPDDLKKAKDILVEKYNRMVSDTTLSYDALTPPAQKVEEECYALRWAHKKFNFSDIIPFTQKAAGTTETIDPSRLKSALSSNGSVEIVLPTTSKVKPVLSPNAKIEGINIPDLGKTVNTDFKLVYGTRVNWSEEKIARDIMQNFYDGHGNTLDGVRIAVKKLPDGQYSIKIEGSATFDYENLQFMGSGTKLENPYNAGGFGEGAKVLVTNLLGKGDAKAVRYSCADWELTFDGANGIMRRTLKKAQNPIEGNSIEFTTGNKKLADAILDSVNYFEHSKNPDFQGLHFDTKDFGFRFLDGEGAKGNIYLTQRFEFETAGSWDKGVDNLDLIFRRKPDPERFKKLIGREMPKDRDRQFLSFDDIRDYTRYFAHDMSDEELTKALMTTKSMWAKLPIDSKKTALSSFIEGLVKEINRRNLAIDFGKEKLAAYSCHVNETVAETLHSYGYRILPEYFNNIGLRNADKVFDSLSVHRALAPTTDEVKKLKLLEEGVRIIKDDIDLAFTRHREKPVFKFGKFIDKDTQRNFKYCGIDNDAEIAEIIQKHIKKHNGWSVTDLDKKAFDEMLKDIEPVIIRKLKDGADDSLLEALQELSGKGQLEQRTREYLSTYKSFNLIKAEDVSKPRFIFDRSMEEATNTLGESITEKGSYLGHWVDRGYLKNADFSNLLATWLHEISHKSGGDGSAEFTYALTDLIQVLVSPGSSSKTKVKLAALEEIFNNIGKTAA